MNKNSWFLLDSFQWNDAASLTLTHQGGASNIEANQAGNLGIRLQHLKCVFLFNLSTHALKDHSLSASYVQGSVQGNEVTLGIRG